MYVCITWYWGAFLQPLLQWKSNTYYILWVCVCSLSYPAFNSLAPYYTVICGLSGCTVFSTLSQKRHDFSEKCKTFIWNISRSKKNSFRYYHKCFSCKVPVILVLFQWNVNLFERFSKNNEMPNFMKIHPVGAEFVPYGRTDRHEEANSRFAQFHERA